MDDDAARGARTRTYVYVCTCVRSERLDRERMTPYDTL